MRLADRDNGNECLFPVLTARKNRVRARTASPHRHALLFARTETPSLETRLEAAPTSCVAPGGSALFDYFRLMALQTPFHRGILK
jgi:hypothetical protein